MVSLDVYGEDRGNRYGVPRFIWIYMVSLDLCWCPSIYARFMRLNGVLDLNETLPAGGPAASL